MRQAQLSPAFHRVVPPSRRPICTRIAAGPPVSSLTTWIAAVHDHWPLYIADIGIGAAVPWVVGGVHDWLVSVSMLSIHACAQAFVHAVAALAHTDVAVAYAEAPALCGVLRDDNSAVRGLPGAREGGRRVQRRAAAALRGLRRYRACAMPAVPRSGHEEQLAVAHGHDHVPDRPGQRPCSRT